jgi:two-component system, LytTR family, response regulator
MESINSNYQGYSNPPAAPVIVLLTCKGVIAIPVQQIIRIQSISNYSKLFFINNKTLVVAKVLRFFEEHPQLSSFVRIHRTHLVNINLIKSYSGSKSGLLYLHHGEMFVVAKRKKAILAGRLNNLNHFFSDTLADISLFSTNKILVS